MRMGEWRLERWSAGAIVSARPGEEYAFVATTPARSATAARRPRRRTPSKGSSTRSPRTGTPSTSAGRPPQRGRRGGRCPGRQRLPVKERRPVRALGVPPAVAGGVPAGSPRWAYVRFRPVRRESVPGVATGRTLPAGAPADRPQAVTTLHTCASSCPTAPEQRPGRPCPRRPVGSGQHLSGGRMTQESLPRVGSRVTAVSAGHAGELRTGRPSCPPTRASDDREFLRGVCMGSGGGVSSPPADTRCRPPGSRLGSAPTWVPRS
ncbi:hypothetical protein AB0L75_36700 [Streptomyces sp. NPDC052101]|uniref:hypothetical protein n=1 Tax=Streptomyces sp. NPDC052101 TaxID=3155763 RepID=UPI003414D7E0